MLQKLYCGVGMCQDLIACIFWSMRYSGSNQVWIFALIFLLLDVVATADPLVGFKDCDAAFLLGAMPRREGMERKDLLQANCKIFEAQGAALDKVAKKTVKV